MKNSFTIIGDPVPKPRMTRSDRWKSRSCVTKYWAWADNIREAATGNPNQKLEDEEGYFGMIAVFHLRMPESWSEKKKNLYGGTIHQGRGDTDNLCKGIKDALFDEDKRIAFEVSVKIWCNRDEEPYTQITLLKNHCE